jgi:hypothetical protein
VYKILEDITKDRLMSGIHSRKDDRNSHAELNIQLSNGKHWHFNLVVYMSERI